MCDVGRLGEVGRLGGVRRLECGSLVKREGWVEWGVGWRADVG